MNDSSSRVIGIAVRSESGVLQDQHLASLLPEMSLDDGGLDKPDDAEQADKQVNQWGERFDVRPPEIWIERLCHEKRSQSAGNDEANLILKSSHSGILPRGRAMR